MKKNVLRKDFIMEIKKSMGRFFSIFFIVALGVAFYSGIRASEPSMRISGDAYFDKSNLMDIKVMGSLGLTKDDIKAISQVEGIEKAEGAYSKDVLCPAGDTEKVVHILSNSDSFNTVHIKEGRMPDKAGECLLDEDFLVEGDYEIGDKITFRSGDEEALTETLTTDTFTVVGIGNSPLYISFGRGNSMIGNGEVSGFVVVDEASFDMDVFTEVYVRVSNIMEETAFTEEYDELSGAAVAGLEAIQDERCRIRKQNIVDEANEEIAEAEQTLEEESGKLADAQEELDEAKSTAVGELAEARKKLEEGEAELVAAKSQIEEGEKQIVSAKQNLAAQQNKLEVAQQEYENGVEVLNKKEQELLAGEQEYKENYDQYMPSILEGKEQIASGKEEITAGRQAIADGMTDIEDNLKQLEAIKSELDEIEQEIAQIDQAIEEGDVGYGELLAKKFELEMQKSMLLLSIRSAGLEDEEELEAAITELKNKKEELNQSLAQLDTAEQELIVKEEELLKQEQELLDAGKQIEDGKIQIEEGKKELAAAMVQIEQGQAQIDAAWSLLKEKEGTLLTGRSELSEGEQELQEGRSEYEKAAEDAAAQIADGEKKIAEGEEKLAGARIEIADAKAEIEKIENPKWYIQTRSDALAEYDGYGENADRMASLGKVFPVLFFWLRR